MVRFSENIFFLLPSWKKYFQEKVIHILQDMADIFYCEI